MVKSLSIVVSHVKSLWFLPQSIYTSSTHTSSRAVRAKGDEEGLWAAAWPSRYGDVLQWGYPQNHGLYLGVPPILGKLHIIMGGPKLGYTLICPRITREKDSWPVDFRGHCPILHIQFACHNRGFTLETWDSMGYFPMWGWGFESTMLDSQPPFHGPEVTCCGPCFLKTLNSTCGIWPNMAPGKADNYEFLLTDGRWR